MWWENVESLFEGQIVGDRVKSEAERGRREPGVPKEWLGGKKPRLTELWRPQRDESRLRSVREAGRAAFASRFDENLASTGSHVGGVRDFEVLIRDGVEADTVVDIEAEIVGVASGCLHQVAVPSDSPVLNDPNLYSPPTPSNPARTYPFTLDPFQAISVAALERGDSVLVSAHTSAGKTVIAEYAIAMALRDGQRVIYTSPIKALSNQKYRELLEKFSDVGLMTGDITISPAASCLVMTTEILRSMLYRGSEIMREVAWVVFDEIHYMRDAERGVVWEETLVLLPNKVRFVFLSATIPNAREFASWISWLHHQPCHLVFTEYRPTPLQHYLFPQGGAGLHLVVDDKGHFREENFQKAIAHLASQHSVPASTSTTPSRGKSQTSGESIKIIKLIMERNFEPVIVFSFSKRDCETLALQTSKLDFNDADEKALIEKVFVNAVESLSEDDRDLPQVKHILPLLQRGIGIHHSGLLPILKEVIEILFQEGLLKVLFATETFAMGLNMPAKTVVFTSVRKFDGQSFRFLAPGEYIQMSGRAGRRGLDDRGIVILMIDEKIEPQVAKTMLMGHSEPLNSSFHITYNMLLNLTRIEGVDPEHLVARSFRQFQCDHRRPHSSRRLADLESELKACSVDHEAVAAEVYVLREELHRLRSLMRKVALRPVYILPFLQPGRLVHVHADSGDLGWGVLVSQSRNSDAELQSGKPSYLLHVLLPIQQRSSDEVSSLDAVPVPLDAVLDVSSIRVQLPSNVQAAASRASVAGVLREIHKQFADGLPLLDPVEDLKVRDHAFVDALAKAQHLEERLRTGPEFQAHKDQLDQLYTQYAHKETLLREWNQLRAESAEAESVILTEELRGMRRILRRLGFVDQHNVIQLKGRVACEINANDSLLLTELIFNGILNDLSTEQIVALMSTFVAEERAKEERVAQDLVVPLRQLREAARRIAQVSCECKLVVDVDDYVARFQTTMMDLVYEWARGAKFSEICKLTNVFEGSIIRCMRRLEELLRQLCAASKAIGNGELETKCAEGISLIKRDIVFSMSLYT